MSSANPAAGEIQRPLTGNMLWLAALVLAAANFMVVLDTTIANVSVPNIAGGLAVSSSQGTYVITSYAVAEAIIVPLTGWLAARFGTVRLFVGSMLLFGLFSMLCGLAGSLETLVLFRVLQGLAGGPLMPMSQTLLLQIFPKQKAGAAIGLWSMTTLIAPIMGPILGGTLCDQASWPWIFYINVPIALGCGFLGWNLLKRYQSRIVKLRVDAVGLALLVVWVGALQLMLDKGKELDWFGSPVIVGMAIAALVGFAAFLIWELTEAQPIVNLRVFRHRGFWASVLTISLAFGSFFGATVLTPQWLQAYMGYTATQAGYATAMSGVLAVMVAPIAAQLSSRMDPRKLVFCGVMWLGCVTLYRSFSTTDMGFWQVALPLLFQGLGMPFFFVPLTGLALASVEPAEVASAAGLMSFMRTLSGAFATSLVTTAWDDKANYNHAELVGMVDSGGDALRALTGGGLSDSAAWGTIEQTLQAQSIMLSTNQIFWLAGLSFVVAACAIWLAPRPSRVADTSQAH
ncbi:MULTISPECIES: DHA2 family efflux MFS transporter permease subunit [Chromobacteriaceae]|uniref:DHA2 family efflux MFS transporter permease subunit n=2 Tax=Chromobacteriaceae TaxID=1499392 RepID=A0ABV0H449_9NEIS|nr:MULTISPECIES: DHA2 family efflux MFS transporter permease subunit [Chromobacteriaceae]AVG14812.1 MFS transporter [Chromobacterium vaccinii]ERE03808.1 DSBA oxidoreductase [Pseudogulbenkiania ferrooxidans EGD-HP2]MCD4502962.1 DHA2 family efflux MFS transporter permease subunit [Chromobacterium piscinae]